MKNIITGLLCVLVISYISPVSVFSADAHTDNVKIEQNHETKAGYAEKTHQQESEKHGHHSLHIDGKNLSMLWAIPFLMILLSIALFPLIAPHFWHGNYGKVSLVIGVGFFIAFTYAFGSDISFFYLVETYLGEFIPFIVLLLALFTVAGGIQIKGELAGSPALNTLIIFIGTVLASWMGTTGAAMLLIRPIIKANEWRRNRIHIIVFFIFLVANIGGSLTPLGDPPLFLGFLKGVSFFWTTKHMILPMLFASAILLTLFFFIDTYYYRQEKNIPEKSDEKIKIKLEGKINLILLLGVIGAVVFSGIWHSNIENPADVAVNFMGTAVLTKGTLAQIIILLIITVLSLKLTPKENRKANDFTWEPILEVAKLFATIFITMIMPIAMLKAGADGPLGVIISKVIHNGEPVNSAFFWATGSLSSFLDNAPTYVVFFNTAGGNAAHLMHDAATTLLAISAGAVFMGANTYIGNAPNFMVKSIAEEAGIPMPSFFGYIIKYSLPILIPTFILVTLVFFI